MNVPGELLRDDVDDERLSGWLGVAAETLPLSASTIALTIAIAVTSSGRDRRPGDLEPRVPVDRRPVGVVVRPGAEVDQTE